MNEGTMGQRIAAQRKKLGLSQEALGERVGVSRQAISKWESDGTVPEIDKLIGLSRLFSVSVGWLLGVEENTPPDALTESQLKMVEEIVKRYQPQPEKKRFPWGTAAAILAVVLAVVALATNPGIPDYSGQISSLHSSYQAIQGQLQSLSGKVDGLASAAEESEKPLQSYEFQLTALDRANDTATLAFHAHPKQWTEGSSGYLSISREGQQVFYEACDWNGANCTAQAVLHIEDGYEYSFILHHEDGTQQIQMLEAYDYRNLAYNTSLQCTVESFSWYYDDYSWVLRIKDCWIETAKPQLGNTDDARWTESGLILYRNGNELNRNITPVVEIIADDHVFKEGYSDSDASVRSVKLEEGDTLKLTFYAALDNGMSIETTVGHWVYQDGNLLLLN